MLPQQKKIFLLTLLLAAAAFVVYAIPNGTDSRNLAMVQMFEPDEAAPFPFMVNMIAPAASLEQGLKSFVFYGYYYYGFPYFAVSAILMLPLQWLGWLNDMPLVMLVLRQLVSVLPLLAALLLLVYLQDGFRTYRSPVMFAFLMTVPAVTANNFWWHPDGITFGLVVLTIFFLQRDRLRFGRNFLLAAVLSGVVTATKWVGVFFFLAVGLTLLLGLILKKASLKKLVLMSLAYLGVMAVAFLAGNPFLLSHWARTEYIYAVTKESDMVSQGYGVVYAKGLQAAWPDMNAFYGEAVFILAAVGAAAWGAWRGRQRLLYGLMLAWFVPVTVSILTLTHFKFQYWLPAILPIFSCLVVALPEKLADLKASSPARLLQGAVLLLVAVQAIFFLSSDVQAFQDRLTQAENNARILFYDQSLAALQPLPAGPRHVYYDARLYVPETPGWKTETTYELLQYSYIQEGQFDVLLLLEQRIRDYLNPGVVGIDPETFARNQQFYRDADAGMITGYHLVYRNAVGLVLVRDDLYRQYFAP